ncbi:MAG: uncharacterized protein KVP18_002124 [Porospora cf. gigantea A]|uniref:uncharacterized protein n=1 Tax=Porospora cf. gigantea A TaxID=2853593 RepID=UPI00355A4FA3|nr:MAG: hypothetical protein KVP18_002124 [Porospora cf. gigantea A]
MSLLTNDRQMMHIIDEVSKEIRSDFNMLLEPAAWERKDPSDVCVPWSNENVPNDLTERLNLSVAAANPAVVVLPFSCQARELERRLKAIFSHGPLQFSEYPELMSMLTPNSLIGSHRWRRWLASCDVRSFVEDGNSMLAAAVGHEHLHRVPFSFIGRLNCLDSVPPTSMEWMYQGDPKDHPSSFQTIHPTLLRKSHLFANELLRMDPAELRKSLIDYIRFLETWFTDARESQAVNNGLKAALAALGSLRLEGATATTRLRSLDILFSIRQLSGETESPSSPEIDMRLQWEGVVSLNEHFFGKQHWLVVCFEAFGFEHSKETIMALIQSFVRGKHPELRDTPADLLPCRLTGLLHDKFVEVSWSGTDGERLSKIKALSDWWLRQRESGLTYVLAYLMSLVPEGRKMAMLREAIHSFPVNHTQDRIRRLLIAIKKVCEILGNKLLPDWLGNLLDSHCSPHPRHLFIKDELSQCLVGFKCFLETLETGTLKETFAHVLGCVFRFAWLGKFHYAGLVALIWRNPELRRQLDGISADLSVLVTPMMPSGVDEESANLSMPNLSVVCLCDLPALVAPFMGEMPALKLLMAATTLATEPSIEVLQNLGYLMDVFRDCNDIINLHKVVDTHQVRQLVRGMEGCARLENIPVELSRSAKRLKAAKANRENMASALAGKTLAYISDCCDARMHLMQRAESFRRAKIPFRNAARPESPCKVRVPAPVPAPPCRDRAPPPEEAKLDTPSVITCPHWGETQPTHYLGARYPTGLWLRQFRPSNACAMAESKLSFGEVTCEWVQNM